MLRSSTGHVESSIESVVTPVELLDREADDEEEVETEEVELLELEEEGEVVDSELVREEVDDELELVKDVTAVVEEVVMFVVVEDVACRVARYAPAIITITMMMTATRIIGLLTARSREIGFNFCKYVFRHLRDSNKL